MHKFIRKFRRGWRTYLLWWTVGALIFVPGMLGLIYYSIHEGDAVRKYAPELRKLAGQTPVYPGFQKSGEKVVLKRSMAYFFTYYNSDAQFPDVKNFYDRVLAEQGWSPPQQPAPSILVSQPSIVSYRRGDYEIHVEKNERPLNSYSIVFLWVPE